MKRWGKREKTESTHVQDGPSTGESDAVCDLHASATHGISDVRQLISRHAQGIREFPRQFCKIQPHFLKIPRQFYTGNAAVFRQHLTLQQKPPKPHPCQYWSRPLCRQANAGTQPESYRKIPARIAMPPTHWQNPCGTPTMHHAGDRLFATASQPKSSDKPERTGENILFRREKRQALGKLS